MIVDPARSACICDSLFLFLLRFAGSECWKAGGRRLIVWRLLRDRWGGPLLQAALTHTCWPEPVKTGGGATGGSIEQYFFNSDSVRRMSE